MFADTSFYVALLNKGDTWHEQASAIADTVFELITTEYIVVEVGNSLQRSKARPRFPEFARSLYDDKELRIVPASEQLIRSAIDLFAKYDDKNWSLTDCASFVVMRDLQLTDALTADRHFAQAGFNVLLG